MRSLKGLRLFAANDDLIRIWLSRGVSGTVLFSLSSSMPHVVGHEADQADGHDQRVPLDESPLQHAQGVRKDASQNRGAVDEEAVDDPLFPPSGNRAEDARGPARAVPRAVDDVGVEP